jgi:hypothetical protein
MGKNVWVSRGEEAARLNVASGRPQTEEKEEICLAGERETQEKTRACERKVPFVHFLFLFLFLILFPVKVLFGSVCTISCSAPLHRACRVFDEPEVDCCLVPAHVPSATVS